MSSTMSVHSSLTKLKIGSCLCIYTFLFHLRPLLVPFSFLSKKTFFRYNLFGITMVLCPRIFFSTLCNTYLLISLNFCISKTHTRTTTNDTTVNLLLNFFSFCYVELVWTWQEMSLCQCHYHHHPAQLLFTEKRKSSVKKSNNKSKIRRKRSLAFFHKKVESIPTKSTNPISFAIYIYIVINPHLL